MDKAPDAYRTISEVADDLDLPQHVLRFWETRFSQIRPLKRGGGRRYYRPEDIDLLKGIRHLLYGKGYTIRGVQRIIKESGVKAIQALGRGEGASSLQKPRGPEILAPGRPPETAPLVIAQAGCPAPPFAPVLDRDDADRDEEEMEDDGDLAVEDDDAPLPPVPALRSAQSSPVVTPPVAAKPVAAAPVAAAPVPMAVPMSAVASAPGAVPSARPVAAEPPAGAPQARLAAEDIRRLQAALYELLECRRRLDEAIDAR